jgi:hypothetical protein
MLLSTDAFVLRTDQYITMHGTNLYVHSGLQDGF